MFKKVFSLNGAYARVMNWLWNVLVLSVLWIVCCLPVVTIGASSTAAYYAAAKVIRHQTGKIHSEFFASFRLNLRQAVLLTIPVLAVFVTVFLECIYLYSDPSVPLAVLYLFYAMVLTILAFSTYLWACLSRFSQTSLQLVRMSAIMTFRFLITSILLLLLQIGVLLGIYLMPWGVLLFPGIGFFLQTFLMEKILLRFSPAVSEDDPEAQKWYYQ